MGEGNKLVEHACDLDRVLEYKYNTVDDIL